MRIKTIAAGLIFVLLCRCCLAQNLTVEKTWQGDKITFAVLKEANIFNYVIEAGNDSLHFEIIGTLKAKGYSLHPINYDFTSYNKSYSHYRVKQIDMSGSCVWQISKTQPGNLQPTPMPGKSVVAHDTSGGE